MQPTITMRTITFENMLDVKLGAEWLVGLPSETPEWVSSTAYEEVLGLRVTFASCASAACKEQLDTRMSNCSLSYIAADIMMRKGAGNLMKLAQKQVGFLWFGNWRSRVCK